MKNLIALILCFGLRIVFRRSCSTDQLRYRRSLSVDTRRVNVLPFICFIGALGQSSFRSTLVDAWDAGEVFELAIRNKSRRPRELPACRLVRGRSP